MEFLDSLRQSCSQLPTLVLCKKKIPRHIKLVVHEWSIKCRRNQKLIAQLGCTLRDELFEPNQSTIRQLLLNTNEMLQCTTVNPAAPNSELNKSRADGDIISSYTSSSTGSMGLGANVIHIELRCRCRCTRVPTPSNKTRHRTLQSLRHSQWYCLGYLMK